MALFPFQGQGRADAGAPACADGARAGRARGAAQPRVTEDWTLLASHARVPLAIAGDPGIRLRDIAATLGITERSACGIVTDPAGAGYVAKHKDGRRNRYQIQAHLPLPGPASQQPAIGELPDLLNSQRETTEHS
jgi:hypothetical protein